MSIYHGARALAPAAAWFKSSYSSEAGGNCVEIAILLPTPLEVFSSFVDHVRRSPRP
ncbi:DUF397 domain-containing protein [Streptomyces sp. NBC_01136]|uniref:DUF397 domain-containing protein n=1 Tax=unclassified Streptomyces TaxID=2593676 RepID=UPI003247DC1E|nr:DUF397 domain-containing protein [Streptomyces sp. NBC_01136]